MNEKIFRNVGAFPAEAMLIFEKNKLILTKVQSWVDQLWRAAEFVVDKGWQNPSVAAKSRDILHARCKIAVLVDNDLGSSPQLVDP